MKLATLDDGTPDGALVVTDGEHFLLADAYAGSLAEALDRWPAVRDHLANLANRIHEGEGRKLDLAKVRAPLPRTHEWLDGSAYLSHVVLVRKARGAEPPASYREDPLMYQGGGGTMLGPRALLRRLDPTFGLDFEAEIGVLLRDTQQGVTPEEALHHIALFVLLNDVTYRGLVPAELEKGFGFLQSKPPTSFAPFAVTVDELHGAFRDGRVHGAVDVFRGGERFGSVDAGAEMHFSFGDLIAHAARTRPLPAGTIVGGGTIACEDASRGSSCIVERRMREQVAHGRIDTPYLDIGETVRIEMRIEGKSVFGAIENEVVP